MPAKLNGVNTQQLGNLMNTLIEKPDTSKATLLVKTEWDDKTCQIMGSHYKEIYPSHFLPR